MTIVPTYGGPLKRDMVQRAYGYCGQSFAEYELTPEEYVIGMRAMNDQMAVISARTYNFPEYGDGNPEDESGLKAGEVLGAAYYVAKLLAPTIGKQLTFSDVAERACTTFLAAQTCIPTTKLRSTTPRGSGNRWSRVLGEYFYPRCR